MRLGLPEMAILGWLRDHERGTSPEIGNACGIAVASARGRLSILEKQKLIVGQSSGAVPPRRVYALTDEGRRKVEI